MNNLKICGPRPSVEAMAKRLGSGFSKAIPALEDRGRYLLEVWVVPSEYPLIEWVRRGEAVEEVKVPAVTRYHLRRDGRIGASWVSMPAYKYLNTETLEPLQPKP